MLCGMWAALEICTNGHVPDRRKEVWVPRPLREGRNQDVSESSGQLQARIVADRTRRSGKQGTHLYNKG